MVARKHIVHTTLYMVDAVVAQFIPFWMVTFITGGLLVASAMAYRHELLTAYGTVRSWLSSRKAEEHAHNASLKRCPRSSTFTWLMGYAVLIGVAILLAPIAFYALFNALAASFGLWMWIFGDVPTFMDGFDRAWEGMNDSDG